MMGNDSGEEICRQGLPSLHTVACSEKCFKHPGKKTLDSWWFQLTHLKKINQIGSFPQVGVKIKKYLKPPASLRLGFFRVYLAIILLTAFIYRTLKKSNHDVSILLVGF